MIGRWATAQRGPVLVASFFLSSRSFSVLSCVGRARRDGVDQVMATVSGLRRGLRSGRLRR